MEAKKEMNQEICRLEKRGSVYLLTLVGPGEHRLNPTLIEAIHSAVRHIKAEPESSSSSAALVTTAEGKFFSNGYDLAWAQGVRSNHQLMSSKLRSLISDLISLPMPTIAAVTGHASAAGFILALSHDYVLMRKDRGFLYMSELDIGLKISAWILAMIKCKVNDPRTRRDLVLGAAKMTAKEAVERGFIDSVHDTAEWTVGAAVELGERLVKSKRDGHVYAHDRTILMKEVLATMVFDEMTDELGSTRSKL